MIRRKNLRMILVFLTPALVLYAMVFIYPIVRTSVMSFFKVETVSRPVREWSFYGVGNYIDMFHSNLFLKSMGNLLKIWLVGGAFVLVTALIFAVILTGGVSCKRFFCSVIYLPNVISAVAMGTIWLNCVFNIDYGLFNNIINFFGGTPVMWTEPGILFWSMLIAYCFGMVGYHMLIFISGIERIGIDYYEAANIEGANVFQKFFFITLPLLKGVIRGNIVIWTVSAAGFFVWGRLFSHANLSADTATPVNYMYELVAPASANTAQNAGAGAAIGVMMTLMVVIVSILTAVLIRNDDVEI